MDRREAILRELNMFPQWLRRNVDAQNASDADSGDTQKVGEADAVQVARDESTGSYRADRLESEHSTTHRSAGVNTLSAVPWPELKQLVRDCTDCKLRAGCTQTVFGVGDENADWLFVGEGPGADEDAQGEPFVGQAGKLLDNMLMAIKLKRGENVYIANIVKCRPPGNRAPETDEVAQCLPYLERQIDLIQPKLIVALGKVASNALLGRESTIASLRNKLHDYRGIPLIVTYHPAYLLRTPSEKAKTWQDLLFAVRNMEGRS